jgi:hypothetical protein
MEEWCLSGKLIPIWMSWVPSDGIWLLADNSGTLTIA